MKTDFAVIFILCPLKDINIWQPAHWFLITLYLGLTYSVHSLLFDYGNKAFRLSASGGLFSLYILSLILMNSNYFLISYWDPCNSNQWEQMEHGQRCFYNRHIYNPVPHFLTWLWEIWEKRFNSGKKKCLSWHAVIASSLLHNATDAWFSESSPFLPTAIVDQTGRWHHYGPSVYHSRKLFISFPHMGVSD